METLFVTIFGVGCTKHRALRNNLDALISNEKLTIEVQEVGDVDSFIANGIAKVPCLAVNGEVVVRGRVPSPKELLRLLRG